MEAQEVFDTVVKHLRNQNTKSTCSLYGCAYRQDMRADSPIRCAVGCLIEDSEYTNEMEGIGLAYLFLKDWVPQSLKDRLLPHTELLTILQRTHDNYNIGNWEEAFEFIARTFKLTVPPKE
jgi:hypothetical protein